jgi:hypothetical protein
MPDPPGHEHQRPALGGLPDEVAADRAAQLDLLARPELVGQVGGDLAVVEPLDGEPDASTVKRGGDRVASLGLITVLRRQPNINVLSSPVARPTGDVEDDRLDARRLDDDLDELGKLPGQSPWYRCSCHGSP